MQVPNTLHKQSSTLEQRETDRSKAPTPAKPRVGNPHKAAA